MGSKFWIIYKHEFLKRVRSKQFIVLTVLGPLFFAAISIIPVVIGSFTDNESYSIGVIDPTGKILPELKRVSESDMIFMKAGTTDINEEHKKILKNKYYALLVTSDDLNKQNFNVVFHSAQAPTIKFESKLTKKLNAILSELKLRSVGLTTEEIEKINVKLTFSSKKVTEKGEESGSAALGFVFGYGMGLLCFMMVFIYGGMLMKGVMEEKANRIVEVIISSVKPIELMLGKIVGIGSVGLFQFIIWSLLVVFITFILSILIGQPMSNTMGSIEDSGMNQVQVAQATEKILDAIKSFKVSLIFYFIFYFLGGYLLYASIFASIGAAIDQESDAGPLTTIVSIPAYIPLLSLTGVMNNPDGPLAFWLSIIPFTSSTIMIARIALIDVPVWQILLSMLLLIVGVWGMAWIAGRIYRIGLLMYGKKITFVELGKWVMKG